MRDFRSELDSYGQGNSNDLVQVPPEVMDGMVEIAKGLSGFSQWETDAKTKMKMEDTKRYLLNYGNVHNNKVIKSNEVFSEHKPFDWKYQLEENRKVVFPSRFCEEACTLILKQQEEIEQLKCRLTSVMQGALKR